MKKIIFAIIVSLALCVSCGPMRPDKSKADKSNTEQKDSLPEKKDSSKVVIEELMDSMTVVSSSVDVLTTKMENNSDAIKELNESIGVKYAKYAWIAILVLLVCVLFLLIANVIADKTVKELILKLESLENKIKNEQGMQPMTRGVENDLQWLTRNVVYLLKTVEQIQAKKEHPPHKNPSESPKVESKSKEMQCTTYLGNVKGKKEGCFFNDIYETRCCEAVFELTVNGNKGEFVPIDLDGIRSMNNISLCVECKGKVQLSSATTFKVIDKGKVTWDSQDEVWLIKSPAKIELK